MQITNQCPQVLSPLYKYSTSCDFNPLEILDLVLTDPVMTPSIASAPATFTTNGNTLTKDDIRDTFVRCCSPTLDLVAETAAKEILGKTLVYYDSSIVGPVKELFVTQSAIKAKLPEPTANIIYTAAYDVIPASKGLIAGTTSFDEWFASLAYFAQPDMLGFAFKNQVAFDEFKAWLATQLNTLSGALPATTAQSMNDFKKKIVLDELTESMWLRKDANDGNDAQSFPRLLISMLMTYARDVAPDRVWCCPFSLDRLLIPETLVLINVERHAQAQKDEISNEWELIRDSITDNIRVMRPGQIQKLTAARKEMQKTNSSVSNMNYMQGAQKHANAKFRKTEPTTTDIVRLIKRLLHKMSQVNHSQNSYKNTKMSFARPNRRDPDDFNKQGRIVSTRYLPDIHLYVDTSGSISERQYQDAVKACIALARKLNINLYFNSFSHVMTTTTFLQTKDRSVSQIWRELQKVPKVTGGTDYLQIWKYIEASKKRRRELSLVITDFEWWPPSTRVKHPQNLYYLSISNTNWNDIVRNAARFSQSMQHIEPSIRKHILL